MCNVFVKGSRSRLTFLHVHAILALKIPVFPVPDKAAFAAKKGRYP
jgi:hypothetical protein